MALDIPDNLNPWELQLTAQVDQPLTESEQEDDDYLSDFQKEMQAVDPSKAEEFLSERFKYEDKLGMWTVITYSDFTGSIADRSNADYLLKRYPAIVSSHTSNDFNTVTVGITKENLNNINADALFSISEDLERIENHGTLDAEDYRKLQREKIAEALISSVWGRFINEIGRKFDDAFQTPEDLQAFGRSDAVPRLFQEAKDISGEEWVEADGGEMTIDVDSLVNTMTHEMLERWLPQVRTPLAADSLLEGREFSCVMAPAPPEIKDAVIRFGQMFITDDELYSDPDDPGGFGRETDVHVTVKYGLHEADPSPELLRIIEETQPFEILIGPVTLFENEKFDVVKFDVDGEGLRELNRRISELPNGDTYPEYHPHMTVAYVTKGTCNELIGKPLFDEQIENQPRFLVKAVTFSGKNKTKVTLFLGKPNLSESENTGADHSDFVIFGHYGPENFPTEKVPQAIQRLVREYGLTPDEICGGNCDEFANDLADIIGGTLMATSEESDLPAHFFVEKDGLYYDSQTPQGVANIRDLPIFQAAQNRRNSSENGETSPTASHQVKESLEESPDEIGELEDAAFKDDFGDPPPSSVYKDFSNADVDDSGGFPKIRVDRENLIRAPLPWQKQGLQQTASGCGKKLTTEYKISFNGKFYRVYATCYSNAASLWFTVGNRQIHIL
jgi:hypothetical protein